ncbi:MAG: hypothetical protein V4619_00330 [Bacteroidota bacterium]
MKILKVYAGTRNEVVTFVNENEIARADILIITDIPAAVTIYYYAEADKVEKEPAGFWG